MTQPITITPEFTEQPPVYLESAVAPTLPPSPIVAQKRSEKAELGLSQTTGMNRSEMRDMIQSGQEQDFRDRAASSLNFERAMRLDKKLIDARNAKGSALTYEEAIRLVDPFNPENGKADPNDVIEKAYSQTFISAANTAASYLKQTVLDDAVRETPEQLKEAQEKTSRLVTHLEFAKTLKQNVDNEVKSQSWAGWLADQGKTMFQPYNEWKMRGLYPSVGSLTGGLLLGDNMKAQADAIFQLPTEEYKKVLPEVIKQLRRDNPTLAAQFLDYVIGKASSDRVLQNVFTILAPADYAALGKISLNLGRKIEVFNRTNTAFKQITAAAAKADGDVPVKAVLQEAAGDVKGAAVTRASDHIDKAMSGKLDPVQDIKESLTSNWRLDGDLLDSNPGNLSRAELTELKDSFYRSGDTFYEKILNVLKVNRTPEPLKSEEAIRAYQQMARGQYPNDKLLDASSPIHMPETNTYHIGFTFGNAEGRLFSDPETAFNFAKMRGWADPRIRAVTGEVEKVPSRLVGTAEDLALKVRRETAIPKLQAVIDKLKNYADRRSTFIGPRRDVDIAAAKKDIDTYQKVLDRYNKELEAVNKKVIMSDPVIEQNGLGYTFTVVRPYKETDDIVRQFLINSKQSRSSASLEGWQSWKNAALGWIRGADDTLAYNESLQRKIATYTQNEMRRWAAAEAKDIEDLSNPARWYKPWTWPYKFTSKEQFEQFNSTLKFAKTVPDPKTGELGYFFKTPGEIQDHYQRFFGRVANLHEIKAYFSHVKLLEANRVLSEIAEYRNRARLGTEQHNIAILDKEGNRIQSGFFDGIWQREFPQGGGHILVMGGHKGDERLYNLGANDIPGKEIKRLKELVDTGKVKVLRVYDPDSHPLSAFSDVAGDNRIRYILSSDVETKPLGINHVNRRGGGHYDIDADFYVKQADIYHEFAGDVATDKRNLFKKIYTGDKTLMPMANGVMGKDVVAKMNRMNKLMKENQIEEAKALSRSLGVDWDTMSSWYDKDRIVNGKKVSRPYIDWDEPFYLVPRNKKIYDIDKSLENRIGKDLFQDGTRSGSDAKQFQVAYNQARDSEIQHTLTDIGTQGNPIYKMVQADYIDPIPSLNRALNRAINSTFMDDYKIHAVEHWLAEAIPHMKASESEVRSAPFYYFHTANAGEFKSATDRAVVSNLLSNKFKIDSFMGRPNVAETYIHGMTQTLVDGFYTKFGPEEGRNILTKAVTIVPLWALGKWQDPISGIRSFAFNAKLGLFALPQFLVQSQTFANIWALGGRHSAAGTFGTMLHTWSRINKSEKFMKAYDDYYSKLNMFGSKAKPGEFMEANRVLERTGFEHVGGEYQLADDQMQHRFIKNEFNNFLDAGQVFFREGEKAARLGAWYTAFREFRHANPTKILTNDDVASILARADLFTVNMSRASASALNSSIFSLPMQFLSYQVRMAELFLGKRLGGTTKERVLARARLLSTYGTLYGLPGALGVTGYPFADSLREAAINKGYVPGDNQFYDAVMNGAISWQLAMISGEFDYKKGTQYDVQGRWGTQGMTFFRESLRSDETIWSLLGGAGIDTITTTMGKIADPFWQFARQLVTDDEEGNTFKLTSSHLHNILTEASSYDAASRFIYAVNTGRWLNKSENYIENVTARDALFRTVTGIKSQDQSDIMSIKNIADAEKNAQRRAEREIIKDYRRGLDAVRDQDYETATTYFTNARARIVAAGISIEQRSKIFAKASRDYEAQTVRSQWNWATKNVPYGQAQTRQDAVQRRQELRQYRNEQ